MSPAVGGGARVALHFPRFYRYSCAKVRLEEFMHVSRPEKLTHAKTILYEIDMLSFTSARFQEMNKWQRWRNLECFLMHFRNLIEFFGKGTPRGDDLSILRPDTIWTDPATRPSPDKLRHLHRHDLWRKYEVREEEETNDKISRYLQHCTEQRVDGKSWNVTEMMGELAPLCADFEALLPDRTRPWGTIPGGVTSEPPHGNIGTPTATSFD
jgi:hypothetical protein